MPHTPRRCESPRARRARAGGRLRPAQGARALRSAARVAWVQSCDWRERRASWSGRGEAGAAREVFRDAGARHRLRQRLVTAFSIHHDVSWDIFPYYPDMVQSFSGAWQAGGAAHVALLLAWAPLVEESVFRAGLQERLLR